MAMDSKTSWTDSKSHQDFLLEIYRFIYKVDKPLPYRNNKMAQRSLDIHINIPHNITRHFWVERRRRLKNTKEKKEMHKRLDYITMGTKKRLPDCLIIGTKKGGTRVLISYLGLHSKVSAVEDEIHYFNHFTHLGSEWYRNQMSFSFPDQITIEKSPTYFIHKSAPKDVYEMNPNMKLIVLLREPVSRAVSDYAQDIRSGHKQISVHEYQ